MMKIPTTVKLAHPTLRVLTMDSVETHTSWTLDLKLPNLRVLVMDSPVGSVKSFTCHLPNIERVRLSKDISGLLPKILADVPATRKKITPELVERKETLDIFNPFQQQVNRVMALLGAPMALLLQNIVGARPGGVGGFRPLHIHHIDHHHHHHHHHHRGGADNPINIDSGSEEEDDDYDDDDDDDDEDDVSSEDEFGEFVPDVCLNCGRIHGQHRHNPFWLEEFDDYYDSDEDEDEDEDEYE
jgi:hypothetical protein